MKRVIYTYCLAILFATTLAAQDYVVEVSPLSETHDTLVSSVDSVSVPEEIPATIPEELSSQELVPTTSDCVKLDRIRGTYYLGDDPLTRKEYRDFLCVNAPDLYNRYRTGNALWATGWTLLYPNPTKGILNIPIGETDCQDARLQIFDMKGVKCFDCAITKQGDLITVDTQNLDAGMYMYRISSGSKEIADGKFVKE